jgi:hypothetical protein
MEGDVLVQLEGIGEAVVGDLPRLRQVAGHLGIVRRIELQQRVVVRPNRMDEGERGVGVAVVVRRLGG